METVAAGSRLKEIWLAQFDELDALDESGAKTNAAKLAEAELTHAIRSARSAVLTVLSELD